MMANPLTPEMTTSSLQETQKQRRKQAKRESKLRLKVEQAKGDVQRAEQKIALEVYHLLNLVIAGLALRSSWLTPFSFRPCH